MHTIAEIQKVKQTAEGTDLIIHIPKLQLQDMLMEKRIRKSEIRFDDGRTISVEQRKKRRLLRHREKQNRQKVKR